MCVRGFILFKSVKMDLLKEEDHFNVNLRFLVNIVTRDFFEWKPLSKDCETNLEHELTFEMQSDIGLEKFQDIFIKKTVGSQIVQSFPVNPDRSQNFVKKVILILESLGVEVREEFYSYVSRSGAYLKNYKSYFLDDKYLLSLVERDTIICEGSTGLVTWSAAKSLTRWLRDRPDLLKGHVLELGAGLGYTGISLVKLGLAKKKMTLTDYHHTVLQSLRHNVEINLPEDQGWISKDGHENLLTMENKDTSTTVSVCALNWQLFDEKIARELNPDVVIGADIVFDGDILPFLVKTIHLCLGENRDRLAIIAGEVRNGKTVEIFENLMKKSSLLYHREVDSSNPPVYIMKIQLE